MTHAYYINFKFQCPQIKFHWNLTIPIHLLQSGCFGSTAARYLQLRLTHKTQNFHYLDIDRKKFKSCSEFLFLLSKSIYKGMAWYIGGLIYLLMKWVGSCRNWSGVMVTSHLLFCLFCFKLWKQRTC
jgi:hypothetical protein